MSAIKSEITATTNQIDAPNWHDNDVVKVIRCKDCAFYLTGYEQSRYCAKDGILKSETYYCAGAERKE